MILNYGTWIGSEILSEANFGKGYSICRTSNPVTPIVSKSPLGLFDEFSLILIIHKSRGPFILKIKVFKIQVFIQ